MTVLDSIRYLRLAAYHRSCTAGGRPEQRGEVLGGRNLAPLGRQWLGGAVQLKQ